MPQSIAHATARTLAAYVALHPESTAQAELERLQARLDSGQLEYEHLVFLSRGPEVIGTAILRPGTRALAPKLAENIAPDEAATFLDHLAGWARAHAPHALLILRDATVPDLGEVPLNTGWALNEAVALYRTDLTQTRHATDPAVAELPRKAWTVPEFLPAFTPIFEAWGEADGESAADHLADLHDDDNVRLFIFSDAGGPIACAALRIMDAGPHGVAAQIAMYGVRPDRRGAGLGRRLHAHLLAVAAGLAPKHEGATDQGNQAMRRILEVNGAVLTGLQQQYRLTRH